MTFFHRSFIWERDSDMSKITIVTAVVFSGRKNEYGWAYKISKGRREYLNSGVFSEIGSLIEAEATLLRTIGLFLYENIHFEDNTKITIFSESRDLMRLMRYGDLSELDDIKDDAEVMSVFKDLLKYRETKARCVYKFISKDAKDTLNQDLIVMASKALAGE